MVGTAGLTLRDGGEHLTITRDTAVAVQAWPDGRRAVVAADGNRLVVEPTMWADGHAIVRQIDRLWPGDLVVPMPERPFAEIPVPDVAAPAPAPARVSRWRLLGAALLFVVMSAWAGALLSAAVMIHHPLPALLALGPGYLAGRAARRLGRGGRAENVVGRTPGRR